MLQEVTKTKSKRRARRSVAGPVRRKGSKVRSGSASTKDYPQVEQGGRVTHVLVPIDEYERLLRANMVQGAAAKLEDQATVWVDADELARELAGRRIAKARKSAGLTQTQLGRKLKLPQSQISRIERNPDRTTVRTLKRIARALGVDVSALI
jgi:DNA-binding XRE family transcriptional regulator